MGKQKKYYAVQIGENYDYDFDGSTVKREAFRIARRYARNPAYAGKEVRVVDIDVDDNGCWNIATPNTSSATARCAISFQSIRLSYLATASPPASTR